MSYLLDTHVFIWLDVSPKKLSERASEIITDPDNSLFLSLTSVWEMQIKMRLGKLELKRPLKETILQQRNENRVVILQIELSHILAMDELPFHHKDPFDRLLIAQAQQESLTFLSDDAVIRKYDVRFEW